LADHPPGPRASAAAWLLAGALLLVGCASVPTVEPPALHSAVAIQPIRIRGPRGRLSRRETALILQRLNAQVPDADDFDRHLAIEQYVAGSPLYTGNRVTILRDGPQTFAAMFSAIRQAHRYLYLEYYILEDVSYDGQKLSDLLVERRAQGVAIDIIYDSIGSLSTPGQFFQRLQAAGVRIRQFNPITRALFHINDRDHRKILIADGTTAIVGGVNLSTDYESTPTSSHELSELRGGSASSKPTATAPAAAATTPQSPQSPQSQQAATGPAAPQPQEQWHDTDLQIDGPAVTELKVLFEQHWRKEGGQADELAADPAAPTAQGDQVVRIIGSQGGQLLPRYYATLLSAIRTARHRIWIEAAYFVPTFQERQALARAARAGVDVRLLVPAQSDSKAALAVQQSYYGRLLRAGIKVYERDDGFLHSKTAVMDGVWSIVGSSNFDHRSVLFNDEVDAVVIGDRTGSQLEQYFQQDLQHAHAVDPKTWRHRPLSRRIDEQFWRLWQQLL
jgi:cardiolipin synthase